MQHVDDSVLIISQLVNNKSYFKKVMHHLRPEYFDYLLDQRIFKFIQNYSAKYSEAPTPLIMKNALSKLDITDDDQIQYINDFVTLLEVAEIVPLEPMLDKTEIYVKEMTLKNAINETISIYKGESNSTKEAIPELIRTALSTSIEDSHGEFYFNLEAAQRRRDAYNNPETKLPFKIEKCNQVTNGGVGKKALHCFVAGPNVGKTAWMISLAADYIELGKNVLYATCEMSEAQIGIRFDARFLNYETSEIPKLDSELYFSKIKELEKKCGQLIIKEYSTNDLTGQRLEILIDELYTKSGFYPDAVFVDYIGICSSAFLKDRGNIGTYYTKVAEEFRACAQNKDVAMWTASQMTTDALDITDPTLKHIGYGQGVAKTADMVWFGIRTEAMDALGQLMIKQEKTRYHKERITRFAIGFDIGYMKMYEVDSSSIPITELLGSGNNNNNSGSAIDHAQKPKIATAFNQLNKKNKSDIKV